MKVAVIYNKSEPDPSDVINIFGPRTQERYNPKTVERVATALEQGGHNVRIIEGNINVAEALKEFMPKVLSGENPGMVFNMAYGIQGQSRYTHIPALLEMLGVPYVGSGPEGHAIALDKVMSKIVFRQNDLPTPGFKVFTKPDDDLGDVKFPVIVKPKMEAVSLGLRVVNDHENLREAVKFTLETYQQPALVEEFIPGREFAVGLLGNANDLEVLPIVEIDLGGSPDAIQSHEDKMAKPFDKICPAKLSAEKAEEMRSIAIEAFHSLGLQDFSRVDIRMDKDENLYILEINSMASLGLTGTYVHSAKVAGHNYEAMVNRMLDVAAVRYFGQEYMKFTLPDDAPLTEKQPLRFRVRTYLRGNVITMIDYLKKMVEISTTVENIDGINKLGGWLSGRLAKLGFHKTVIPQVEIGNILYFTNHDDQEDDVLILSHLDISQRYVDFSPFREDKGRIYGTGVAECKGGLSILLGALQALKYTRKHRGLKIGILLTTDETLGGRFSKKHINDMSSKAKCVVGLSHGSLDGGIITSCSGMAIYKIEMTNIKDESLKHIPDIITTVSRKIGSLQKLSDENEGIEIFPTKFEGKAFRGYSSDYATANIHVRYRTKSQMEDLDKQIKRIVKRNLIENKTQLRIRRIVHRPPVEESDKIRDFYSNVEKIAKRLEINVSSTRSSTSSDLSYVVENVPRLEGLGPIGAHAFTPYEFIIRDSLVDRAALLAMVIYDASKKATK